MPPGAGVEHGHLSAADAGADVAHAVVVAYFLVLVVGESLAGLGGEEHDTLFAGRVGADKGAAARGGDHLVAVETQHAILAEGAAYLPVVARAEGFGSILDEGNAVFFGHGHDVANPGRHAVEVDHDDGARLAARLFHAVADGRLEQFGVHVPGVGLGIDEDRRGPQVSHGVRGGAEREALAHHLVARPDAQSDESQVHGRRARGEGHHLLSLQRFLHPALLSLPAGGAGVARRCSGDELLQVALKSVDVGAQGHHPIGVECLLHIFHFIARHVCQTENDSLFWFLHGVSFQTF